MQNDMTKGNETRVLVAFAIPMVLGNLFQQMYSIIDSMVVGNFVGPDALAAVGASTPVVFLFVAVATGMSVGCSVVISQLFGARQYTKMKTAISTALLSILALSVMLTVVGLLLSKKILQWMNTPDTIMADANTFLMIYFAGLVFLFTYNGLTAVYNGLGKSRIPLFFLAVSSLINIGLDLLFVIRFEMGVEGVALATLIAQGVSAVASLSYMRHVINKIVGEKTEKSEIFSGRILKRMLAIVIPSSLQQSIVSIGFLCVQVLINGYGPTVIAGYTAATKIDNIAIMPMANVGNAVSTFTAQNMGAKKVERVKRGYRAGLLMSSAISLTVTLLFYLFGADLIGTFVSADSGAGVIDVGVNYLRVVSLFYILMGIMNVTNGVLRGSGDMKIFMVSTLGNFAVRVIMAFVLAGTALGYSAIWWAIPMGWAVGLIISVIRFLSGKWKNIYLV